MVDADGGQPNVVTTPNHYGIVTAADRTRDLKHA